MTLGVIFANSSSGLFSVNSKLPWSCKPDMDYFKNLTLNTSIVMGRKTADSLEKYLPGRKNYVLSNSIYNKEGFSNLKVPQILEMSKSEKVWVIGGVNIIKYFLENHSKSIDIISHTSIGEKYIKETNGHKLFFEFNCSYIPKNMNYEKIKLSEDLSVHLYYRSNAIIPKLDIDYLDIGRKILDNSPREGRNGLTRCSFDSNNYISFNFDYGFPILKSKQVWWKGIKEELKFFWEGKTDTLELESNGIKIWNGNTSKEFLDKTGKINLKPGEMGPMYGFQWRHFNAQYQGAHADYSGKGIDQIEKAIDLIVNDPHSRRIIITAFNPEQAEEGVLFPCHSCITHFLVSENESGSKINIKTYQRSADWFLGVPFNISSYGLFLVKIVDEVNKKIGYPKFTPGNITIYFGDAHIYESHVPIFTSQYVNSLISKFQHHEVGLDANDDLIDYYPERKFAAAMIA